MGESASSTAVVGAMWAGADVPEASLCAHPPTFCACVLAQGDVSIAMGEGEVASALKAGQDAGRLPQLSPGKDVGALLNALAYDSLGVSAAAAAVRLRLGQQ